MSTRRKAKIKKGVFRKIHLQAFLFLIVYSVISKTIFIRSLASASLWVSFLVPYFFGVVAGIIFLYLFSHEDFFHFMKDVEHDEKKKEHQLLKKYKHYGKVASTLIIAAIGGPVLAALTIRFLLNKFWYKYLLIAVGNVASTAITVSLGKGLFTILVAKFFV